MVAPDLCRALVSSIVVTRGTLVAQYRVYKNFYYNMIVFVYNYSDYNNW